MVELTSPPAPLLEAFQGEGPGVRCLSHQSSDELSKWAKTPFETTMRFLACL